MADPKDNNDDNWKAAVDMLTGYILPARDKLFENLKGNDGIPMIHVRLDKVGGPGYSSGFIGSGGWHTKNTDYTIPFYRPSNDAKDVSAGTMLYMYRAHITFLASSTELPPSGDDIIADYSKTSTRLKDKGGWNKEGADLDWNTTDLTRYIYGSMAALEQLTTSPYSTHGFSSRGLPVPDGSYVDLNSFTDAAKAFDRAVKFFEDSAVTTGKWDTENIGEGSDSWDGTSAAVFKALIHKLARNYEGYADQLNGENGNGTATEVALDGTVVKSQPARALIAAQAQLYEQAKNLELAWKAWRPESNPQRWLYDMLEKARLEILNQIDYTDFEVVGSGPYSSGQLAVVALDGFKNDIVIDGESYGTPSDMATWKKVAEKAVSLWGESVQNFLGVAASDAIVAINKAFTDAQKAFDAKITDKDKKSLSDISAKEEADKAKKEAEAEKAAAEAEAARLRAEAEAEKAAAKAEAEREKAEAEAEKAAAKAEAEREKAEAKAEREKEKAEANAEKEQAKAEAEKEKAEAKAEQEAAKAEAEREKEQAKAEAEKEKAEAKAEQEAAKAEADREKEEAKAQNEQDRAEAKQAQEEAKQQAAAQQAFAVAQANQQRADAKKAQDEAKAEREAEKGAAEQEKAAAKQEQEAAKAEAEQEKAEAKAEQEQEKAAAKQEQEAAKAEAEQEKAEAKAEQQAEKAAAKEEQAAAKAEAEQQRAEAKAAAEQEKAAAKQEQEQARADSARQQDEARQDSVREKQQARLEAEHAKVEAQEAYDQQKAEAQQERAAAEREADRREAEAKQQYEQEKAEAQQEREQAREEAEQERTEARQQYDREIAAGTDERDAREEYDRRLAEIDAAEQDAVKEADDAEARAKDDYQEQKAAAQEQRDEARSEAEQARRDAKAQYDQRMGDIQAEYDRIGAGEKDIGELIRQRIADLPQPPDLSSYGPSGPGSAGGLGSGGSEYSAAFSDNLYNQEDLASALGRPEGDGALAGSSAGSSGGTGSPMMPPMMRGAGGEAGGTGERVRTVVEPGAARAGRVGATTPTVEDEEHRVVPRSTQTSSSTPFMPPMGGMPGAGGAGQQTESGDRERTTWLVEDEDVWGTDEGGAPQALGR